jgi:hypothetical protein
VGSYLIAVFLGLEPFHILDENFLHHEIVFDPLHLEKSQAALEIGKHWRGEKRKRTR